MRLGMFTLLPALAACGQMAIDGQVLTVTGEPASQARVSLIGSPCTTVTDAEGRFSLPCQPGSYSMVITKEGFVELKDQVEATELKRYDLGEKRMIAIPGSEGLFLLRDHQYLALERSYLHRTIDDGSVRTRSWCLDRTTGKPATIPAGVHAFFDNKAPEWRPFRLDADGCAYRDRRDSSARWEVIYRERPESREELLQVGRKIILMDLPEGEYFLADWDQGFFTADANDAKRYTGSWLQVEG
mgnify:CR=1 FL=1